MPLPLAVQVLLVLVGEPDVPPLQEPQTRGEDLNQKQ